MSITILQSQEQLQIVNEGIAPRWIPLYSKESFELLTKIWLKIGWQMKVPYTYSYLGFPILQIPDDMIRAQEVIFRLKPDVIVETGVAHGGSLIFYASLCRMIGHGQVIGVEKGLRCRAEIEASPFSDLITLIEGDSVSSEVIDLIRGHCYREKVLVFLDSCHSADHVRKELEAYSEFIQPGFYIVATDGNMKDLADLPRGNPKWAHDNPQTAALEFVADNPEFEIEQPTWPFNESSLTENITYWPNAWIRRKTIASAAGDKAVQSP